VSSCIRVTGEFVIAGNENHRRGRRRAHRPAPGVDSVMIRLDPDLREPDRGVRPAATAGPISARAAPRVNVGEAVGA